MMIRFVRFGIGMLPLTVIALLIVEILATNALAGVGTYVAQTDRSIDALKEQNQLMQEKVASLSSLRTVEDKARNLGFLSPPVVMTIGTEDVAFRLQP